MISTPLSDSAMCGARGVKSSSHVSAASVVSEKDSAASPAQPMASWETRIPDQPL
jgi:hypothetical protein